MLVILVSLYTTLNKAWIDGTSEFISICGHKQMQGIVAGICVNFSFRFPWYSRILVYTVIASQGFENEQPFLQLHPNLNSKHK